MDPSTTSSSRLYYAMIACIAPRPIAWVSTISGKGVTNLAPFSFFNGVASEPPTLLFCPGFKDDGTPKDTLRNIEETREFVVNVVPYSLAQAMNATSASLDHGISEFETCGIESAPGMKVRPPRVAKSPVHFECKLYDLIRVGSGNIVIGEILLIDIDDSVLDAKGKPDPEKLDLIGRMGGATYSRTTGRFDLRRPD